MFTYFTNNCHAKLYISGTSGITIWEVPPPHQLFIMFTPARDFPLETPWRIIIPNPNVNKSFPLILITKKGVNLSSCVLAKPNQLLSIIICLSKRQLFLIKPEDLFVLVRFWECWSKHAVNIMFITWACTYWSNFHCPLMLRALFHCDHTYQHIL
jgi:hypothetical protein